VEHTTSATDAGNKVVAPDFVRKRDCSHGDSCKVDITSDPVAGSTACSTRSPVATNEVMEFVAPPSSPDPELFNADDDPRRHIDTVASQNMVGSDVANPGLTQCLFPTSAEELASTEARRRSSVVAERWKMR
jgi:hypothetical protein